MLDTAMPYGRLRAFSGPRAEETANRVGQWAKAALFKDTEARRWCRENSVAIKASGEGVNSAGGFLVPNELYRAIINLREQFGAFRASAEIVPMGGDAMSWPRRTGGFTASFTAEGAAITESQASVDNIGLTAKKLAALGRMSSEIAEDSAPDVAEFLANEIAYAFAVKEDDCGFNGDGTSTYGGIRGITTLLLDGNHNAGKITAASAHNTFATLDATDLGNLMGTVPAIALPGARWYVSQFGYAATFCRLAASSGGLVATIGPDGRIRASFLGFPVEFCQKLPQISGTLSGKVMMLFGDLSLAAALGERRGVTVGLSQERYLEFDQIGIKGTERVDINAHDLGDNTTAGPIAGLVGA